MLRDRARLAVALVYPSELVETEPKDGCKAFPKYALL